MASKVKFSDRDWNISTLAEHWGETFAETKRSLEMLSDKDVSGMARRVKSGQEVR